MAVKFQTLFFLELVLAFSISVLPSQGSPQNIEVFYLIETPSPAPGPISPKPTATLPSPERLPDSQPSPASSSSSNDTNSTIAKAVAATAASTIVIAGIFFLFIRKYVLARRQRERVGDGFQGAQPRVPPDEFARVNGNIKGLIVDENGLDVLYWRHLQNGENKNEFLKQIFHSPKDEEGGGEGGGMVRKGSRSKKVEPVQEIPLLRGKSSTSHVPPPQDNDSAETRGPLTLASHGIVLEAVEIREESVQSKFWPPASMPPPPIQTNKSPITHSLPPPPPPPPASLVSASLKVGGSVTSLKPPPALAARDKSTRSKPGESSEDGATENGNYQVKLKPLHWAKVNNNADDSMVWSKINGGSFKFDGDLMEALFGYVVTNRKSPTSSNNSMNTRSVNTSSPSKIMVLDARKSQNIAIVLKSLALSRRELLEALNEGQGLEADTVEKLMRIAPTEEELSQILDFNGDPTRLADAESFLFHILKAIPSAFTRLNAMQFRSNYDFEVLHMKESLQILDLGCKELRSQRLFMKLLEAILKAGNRMNAGTARGNAQAFNLTSLLKLSDVKSTDAKTTLLHFVVEEVVRSEGRKCFISRSRSLNRNGSSWSSNSNFDHSTSKGDIEKEYITLGLPVIGGLSAEFTNVKKAAALDFNTFSGTCSALTARVTETKQLVLRSMADGKGGFAQEMKGFIDDAEEELKVIREEQKRVMDHVKRTTEYYQAGASKDSFQVFVIVRDFLGMVDQVCVQIARNQQGKSATVNHGSQSPNSHESRTKMRFPILPANFMRGKSRNNSRESDVDS